MVVREMYFRADRSSAVLVLEADSVAAAEHRLREMLLVKARLIHFDLIPLAPYSGLARLMK